MRKFVFCVAVSKFTTKEEMQEVRSRIESKLIPRFEDDGSVSYYALSFNANPVQELNPRGVLEDIQIAVLIGYNSNIPTGVQGVINNLSQAFQSTVFNPPLEEDAIAAALLSQAASQSEKKWLIVPGDPITVGSAEELKAMFTPFGA